MSKHVYGPFHRKEARYQTCADAMEQVRSGEIWGRAARWSNIPSVKAYAGYLPAGERGINFTTPVRPHPNHGSPLQVKWYYPNTPGVAQKSTGTDDYAVISACVENKQP